MAAMWAAAQDQKKPGHDAARRIVHRNHFHLAYERNPLDVEQNPQAAQLVFKALREKYGPDLTRVDSYRQKGGGLDFPVVTHDNRIVSSKSMSATLRDLPTVAVDYVFVDSSVLVEARSWLNQERDSIIQTAQAEEKIHGSPDA